MHKYTIQILSTSSHSPAHFFRAVQNNKINLAQDYGYLPTANHMNFIIRNWDNLDRLNEKFNELQNNKINLAQDYGYLPTANHMNFIIRNWDNLDRLNEKFNELREKEINNSISKFEKSLLQDVLKKRILDFPNPYLPSDHEEAIEMSKKYGIF